MLHEAAYESTQGFITIGFQVNEQEHSRTRDWDSTASKPEKRTHLELIGFLLLCL